MAGTPSSSRGVSSSEVILQTLADAKGDVIGASAADTWGRLAVGADDTVLTAASGETTGLKWASVTPTPVTARQNLAGANVNIANGANARLTWANSFGPNVLLDRSVPDIPTVITAGIYAVAVIVIAGGDMTAAGYYQAQLELDSDGDDATAVQDSRPASVAFPRPVLAMALTFYIPAAGSIRLKVINRDGAAAVDFGISGATVQKIT